MQILANKQRMLDAFADRLVAVELADQAFNREATDEIVWEELKKYVGAW